MVLASAELSKPNGLDMTQSRDNQISLEDALSIIATSAMCGEHFFVVTTTLPVKTTIIGNNGSVNSILGVKSADQHSCPILSRRISVSRLRFLSYIYAIDICAYAVMSNH